MLWSTSASFNPCFSGSGVLSNINGNLLVYYPMFQSLFFWKWGFKHAITEQKMNEAMFQSLFFWKWGFKSDVISEKASLGLVSILVFLEVGF